MDTLTNTLLGMAGLGLLFALTAWLPLRGDADGCGSCGGGCASCPNEGGGSGSGGPGGCSILDDLGGSASGNPSPGTRFREAKDGA